MAAKCMPIAGYAVPVTSLESKLHIENVRQVNQQSYIQDLAMKPS